MASFFFNRLFDWRPDIAPGARLRHERIVILKHMFDVKEFEVGEIFRIPINSLQFTTGSLAETLLMIV